MKPPRQPKPHQNPPTEVPNNQPKPKPGTYNPKLPRER
jgi:hypothetical protein